MKKKNVVCLLVVIICGFVLGEVVYSEYKRNLDQSSYNAYLIKIGSFKDDYEVDPSNYLVLKENGLYNMLE